MRPVTADTIDDAMKGPWFWMRHIVCARDELVHHLGPPHWTVPEDGLIYDYHHWVFAAECGFRIWYSFSAAGPPEGVVNTSLPEDDHFLRHDSWACTNTKRRDGIEFKTDIAKLIAYHSKTYPEVNDLASFQVWRMGDDGNEMPVGFPTSAIDARCHVLELESHKHKQIYWCTRCKKMAEQSVEPECC